MLSCFFLLIAFERVSPRRWNKRLIASDNLCANVALCLIEHFIAFWCLAYDVCLHVFKYTFQYRGQRSLCERFACLFACLFVCLFDWLRLAPLSTIFPLYRGGQFYWWRKPEDPKKTTDWSRHWQTLSHNVVPFILIEIRTHNISGDRHWLHR
jgi:hypothetical protein